MPVNNPTQGTNPVVGALVTLQATFQRKRVNADPSGAVKFSFLPPGSGTPTVYTFGVGSNIYRDTTPLAGIYYTDMNLNISGRWYWRWEATGQGQTVSEGYFDVEPSSVLKPSP